MQKRSQSHHHHSEGKTSKGTAKQKQPSSSKPAEAGERLCPKCGTPMPDNARFCPKCGYAFKAPDKQAPQTQHQPEPAIQPAKSEELDAQPVSAAPNTPQPDEGEELDAQPVSAAPNTSQSDEGEELDAQPVSAAPNTSQSDEKHTEEPRTLLLPPPLKAAPSVKVDEAQRKTPLAPPNTPLPRKNQPLEELNTIAVPSTPKNPNTPLPLPRKNQPLEELNTIAVPSAPKNPPADRIKEIEAQETRALPAKRPASAPQPQPPDQQATRIFKEGNNLPPRPAGEKNARRGQSGATYPRVETPRHRAVGSPKSGQLVDDTTQKNRTIQTLPRGVPAGTSTKLLAPPGVISKTINPLWHFISPIFARAEDPEPEKSAQPEPRPNPWQWLPVVILSCTLGLFTVATAYNVARANDPGAELYFWLGLGLIFLPALIRLIHPQAARFERVSTLCVVALCLYLTKVELSPLYFSGYDELLHWRTVNDIMSSGHLFAPNPLLPVSPYYPGLEIVTSALSNLSGLSTFQAGSIVVGVASLLMVLSLYLLCELLSSSTRLASIATMIYMTNPHYLLFDHQFAYESLALPLATFVLYAMARYEILNKSRPWIMAVAWLVLTAMDLTHHATNFVFEGLFLLWATIYLFLRPLPLRKSIVIPTVIFGLALTVTTVLLIGNTVISYFTSFFADIGSEIAQSLSSSGGGSRQLFTTAGVTPTPLWERLVPLAAVGLITLAIPLLLLCFWRRYRAHTLVWVFAIIIIFYPVLQVLRLTSSGAELSDRTSAFVFIAISFLAAVAIVQFWPVRLLRWKQSALISAAIVVLFMGGIILGDGVPASFIPGPYEVSADARSIEPEGIQAALWAHQYLGPNNRLSTDRINQLLMSAYGGQYLVTKISPTIDEADVFFSPVVSSYEIYLLQQGHVHYLVVDMRLSQGLPQDGYYFEAGEPNANAEVKPLNPQYLTKFATVPQINRLFDSGDIAIYDTGPLINSPQKP